jgi:hypothetical protein
MKIDIESINEILEKEELTEEDLTALQGVADSLTKLIKEKPPEPKEGEPKKDEAASAEPPKDTPPKTDTPPEEDKEKEEVKQEILDLIETLFEIEKETKEEKNE